MSAPFSLRTIKTTYNPEKKEWSAPKILPLHHPKASLGQLVIKALSDNLNDVGQICHEDGHEMKNWEILRDSVRAALSLRQLGLNEGDVLGLAASNSRHIASIVFGALINGNPVSTVNPHFGLDDVANIFGITQPKVVFCDEGNYRDVKGALEQLNNPSSIYVFTDEEAVDEGYLSVQELFKAHPEEQDFV